MNAYLLDSTVLIDISRGEDSVIKWLLKRVENGAKLFVSSITITEFMLGVPVDKRGQALHWLQAYPVASLNTDSAAEAGFYRFDHARMGYTLSVPDAIQAVLARRHHLVLATSNPKHFPGIRVEDPRDTDAHL